MLCPFCRTPSVGRGYEIARLKKLMNAGNGTACSELSEYYKYGSEEYSIPQDLAIATKLWLKAGELGYATAYYSVGRSYDEGLGVEFLVESDEKKAMHFYEQAAISGDVNARYNIACTFGQNGDKTGIKTRPNFGKRWASEFFGRSKKWV